MMTERDSRENLEPHIQLELNISTLKLSRQNGQIIKVKINRAAINIQGHNNLLLVSENLGNIKVIGNDNLIKIDRGNLPELEGLRNRLSIAGTQQQVSQVPVGTQSATANVPPRNPFLDSDDDQEEEGEQQPQDHPLAQVLAPVATISNERRPSMPIHQNPPPGPQLPHPERTPQEERSPLHRLLFSINHDVQPLFTHRDQMLEGLHPMRAMVPRRREQHPGLISFPNGHVAPIITIPVTAAATPFASFDCSICYSSCENRQSVATLNCRHEFHSQCVIPWLRKNGNCPLCRSATTEVTQYEGSGLPPPAPEQRAT